MSSTATLPLDPVPASYEEALAELEQLVSMLESGNTPLEQLLASYQRGAALLEYCKDKLAVVENQTRILENGPQGLSARPWEEDNA